jgi:acetyl esterase/lipase
MNIRPTRRHVLAGTAAIALPLAVRAQPVRETRTYKTVGALNIQADIIRGIGAGPRPAILYIHGGGLMMASRRGMPPRWELERFTGAGYTVVSIDYRLAPATKLPDIAEDVADAWAWMRSGAPDLNIDPARIAVMGMSAGAYLALMAGYRLSPRPRAVVSFYGYGDLTGAWSTQPSPFYSSKPAVAETDAFKTLQAEAEPSGESARIRSDLYLYARQRGLLPKLVSGHDPVTDPGWFAPYEPIRHITPDYPPTMLLQGQKDTDVPFEQAKTLGEALQRNGVVHQLVSDPDWDHAFDYRANDKDPKVAAAFNLVLAFLAEQLR